MLNRMVPHLNLQPPALRQVGFKLARVEGINLAQGLCLMPMPPEVMEGAFAAMRAGRNVYSPAQGVTELREALAIRLRGFNRLTVEPDQIVVTTGSTGAFETVCATFLEPGDEVVSFEPFYPYHRNALARYQAVTRAVPLMPPEWSWRDDDLERAITPRTKFVLLTTPNNPTGKVFTRAELERIAAACGRHNLFCVTDEVYEYLTYDGHRHISMASMPGMAERTITMSSYSKTFAITGWRIGYLAAPRAVAEVLKVVFDQMFVCAPTPLQVGVAAALARLDETYYEQLRGEYARKREILMAGLAAAGLTPHRPQGAYFILADTSAAFPGIPSEQAVELMIDRVGVGAVPATDFIADAAGDPVRSSFLRFSYAVPDELLHEACARLGRLA